MLQIKPNSTYRTLVLFLCWALGACDGGSTEQIVLSGATMGTTYTIKVIGDPSDTLQAEIDRIFADINRKMSTYDPDSELSRFNQNQSTDWIAISEELRLVMAEALAVSALSEGAFDVTVGPLVNLWGFGPQITDGGIPSEQALAKARARTGYRQLHLRDDPPALKKDRSDLYIDLSAIAKGYAVDKVADHLDIVGVPHYLVELGGELRAKGHNPQGKPWTIAIERPTPGKQAVEQVIQITAQGVATSGDYRNFFELNGQRYAHAINPHTGWPVKHRLGSVTVVAKSTMRADAMATALLVLGPEAGMALAQSQHLAAFFIIANDHGFTERSTPTFAQYLLK